MSPKTPDWYEIGEYYQGAILPIDSTQDPNLWAKAAQVWEEHYPGRPFFGDAKPLIDVGYDE